LPHGKANEDPFQDFEQGFPFFRSKQLFFWLRRSSVSTCAASVDERYRCLVLRHVLFVKIHPSQFNNLELPDAVTYIAVGVVDYQNGLMYIIAV